MVFKGELNVFVVLYPVGVSVYGRLTLIILVLDRCHLRFNDCAEQFKYREAWDDEANHSMPHSCEMGY